MATLPWIAIREVVQSIGVVDIYPDGGMVDTGGLKLPAVIGIRVRLPFRVKDAPWTYRAKTATLPVLRVLSQSMSMDMRCLCATSAWQRG